MKDFPHLLHENFDISFLSTFRTEARARYYFDVITYDDVLVLPELFWFAEKYSLPITIIAGGTNCLFAFDTYEGIIVRNRYTGQSGVYESDGKKMVSIHSGEMTTSVAIHLYQHQHISTLIPWVGLPGTFGGATIGNAGCFGLEMADIFVRAKVLDLSTGFVVPFTYKDMGFAYRESILKSDRKKFVIETTIDLSPKGSTYESYTPANLQSLRKLKQPPGFSCGSFFKNPSLSEYHDFIGGHEDLVGERGHTEMLSAGRMIDEAGLKGTRVGGVQVSERHGNFFINDEKGTWQDILQLRDIVKAKVFEKYGIELHEEVRIIQNPEHV